MCCAGIDSQVLSHYDQLMAFADSGNAYVVYQQPGVCVMLCVVISGLMFVVL